MCHLSTFLKNYLAKNKDTVRVYACGGDGTVHEVANGLVGFANAELAIYPAGTGNDFVNGYFYKCVTDGEPTPTYSWENIKIQDDAESDFHVIADEFDDTVAYAVGDYCLYNDDLYICTTAHAAGVWDANDFAVTNVTEELKKKTEYKEFVGTVAEFNALTLAEKLSYNMANFTDD